MMWTKSLICFATAAMIMMNHGATRIVWAQAQRDVMSKNMLRVGTRGRVGLFGTGRENEDETGSSTAALTQRPHRRRLVNPTDTSSFTFNEDFDLGASVNVNHDVIPHQLQLNGSPGASNFIWVAASGLGTVVKINTDTGDILGEFRTGPQGYNLNPSRTTVDLDGSVWVANRNTSPGTVTHIGLEENGQCYDRNNNGVIDSSTGLGDVRDWPNNNGGVVDDALDECIIHFVAVSSTGTRHVSVNSDNDVWVSGTGGRNFDLVQGGNHDVSGSGTIIRTESSVGFGGYGGLIDADGFIWSARSLIRWDTSKPLTGANGAPAGPDIGPLAESSNWGGDSSVDSYGLCIDSQGNVWSTQLSGNAVRKYDKDGQFVGSYQHGHNNAQGCVVDGNDDVWVAHSLLSSGIKSVGHLKNDGTFVGNVDLGDVTSATGPSDPAIAGRGPTGVAVDANGKVWTANYYSNSVSRIDPTLGPVGADGVTPVGKVDLTRQLRSGSTPYNYSDMTGSTLTAAPSTGTWRVVYDGGDEADMEWRSLTWNTDPVCDDGSCTPEGSELTVKACSSSDGTTCLSSETVASSGQSLNVENSRYLMVTVSFQRELSTGPSPILTDLAIDVRDLRNLCSPPEATCNDKHVPAGPGCVVAFTPEEIGEGSSHPDGGILSYQMFPPGPFPLGETPVTLIVSNEEGLASLCEAIITVYDDEPLQEINLECGTDGIILPCDIDGDFTIQPYYVPKANGCEVYLSTTLFESGCYACEEDSDSDEDDEAMMVDMSDMCEVWIDPDTNEVVIADAGKAGNHIMYTVAASDSNNDETVEATCTICVDHGGCSSSSSSSSTSRSRGLMRAAGEKRVLKPAKKKNNNKNNSKSGKSRCPEFWDPKVDTLVCGTRF